MNINELITDTIELMQEMWSRAEKAERERDEAIKALSDEARNRGEAEGRLEASEMAGVVDGWKARAEAAEAKVARLHEALADLRKTAALLQQNALGCATNHYGQDFQLNGMPGWLVDTAASIERALAAMEATDE